MQKAHGNQGNYDSERVFNGNCADDVYKSTSNLYYALKNRVYQEENYFSELREIEKRGEFVRSITFASVLMAIVHFVFCALGPILVVVASGITSVQAKDANPQLKPLSRFLTATRKSCGLDVFSVSWRMRALGALIVIAVAASWLAPVYGMYPLASGLNAGTFLKWAFAYFLAVGNIFIAIRAWCTYLDNARNTDDAKGKTAKGKTAAERLSAGQNFTHYVALFTVYLFVALVCGQVHANEMESYYLRVYGYGVSLFYMGDAQAVTAPAHIGLLDPPSRSLDANLYMQWSAEYRACCHQTYLMAAQRVREKVGGLPEPSKPYAVVLDLDETVLDNSVFQSRMLMQNHGFSQAEWDVWEQKHYDEVSLVPGAKKFIEDVQGLSVTIVYVSNRSEKYREETKCVLNRFGLPLESDACLCLASGSSDKTSRRMVTDCGFTVLLLIGDNLRDFDEQFKIESHSDDVGSQPRIKSALLRADKVDRTANRFGEDWFILPNPAYGEWTKVFRGNGADLGFLREVAPVE